MPKYIIGIDGGGTKTAFVLSDEKMNELAIAKLSRSNPADVGIDGTAAVLVQGIKQVCADAGIALSDLSAVFAGIAGIISNDGYITSVSKALAEFLPDCRTLIGSDGYNPLYAAYPDSDGVGIICGTGSSCFIKKGDKIYQIGGYGPFDKIGNGYEIGESAINHALRALDGRDETSPLVDAVLRMHGEGLKEHLGDFLAKGKASIAAYAIPVFETYDADRFSREIIQSNMRYVAELANAAGQYFDGEYDVTFTGSIGINDIAFGLLQEYCSKRCHIHRLETKPVYGALARAKMLLT